MLKTFIAFILFCALLFGADTNPYIQASKKKKDPHITSTHGKPVPRFQLLPPITAKKPKPKPKPKPKVIIDENGKEVVVQPEEQKLSPQELEIKEAKMKCIDDDSGAWCWKLGIYYLEGKIVEQDYNEALKAFEAGCVKKSGGACYNAGYLYEFGRGNIPYDYKKATDFFLKSCNYGYNVGCNAWRDMQ